MFNTNILPSMEVDFKKYFFLHPSSSSLPFFFFTPLSLVLLPCLDLTAINHIPTDNLSRSFNDGTGRERLRFNKINTERSKNEGTLRKLPKNFLNWLQLLTFPFAKTFLFYWPIIEDVNLSSRNEECRFIGLIFISVLLTKRKEKKKEKKIVGNRRADLYGNEK